VETITTTRSTVSKSETISDTATPYSYVSIPYYTANFHVKDHDVLYGDGTVVQATAKAGSVISLEMGDLKDIFFQNATAGNTATVNCVFTSPRR
jgi:hypothetical protein